MCEVCHHLHKWHMVQGHCVYCLISRVNILLQGTVQRVTSPLLCRFQLLYSIAHEGSLVLCLWVSISFMWGIVGFLSILKEIKFCFNLEKFTSWVFNTFYNQNDFPFR